MCTNLCSTWFIMNLLNKTTPNIAQNTIIVANDFAALAYYIWSPDCSISTAYTNKFVLANKMK